MSRFPEKGHAQWIQSSFGDLAVPSKGKPVSRKNSSSSVSTKAPLPPPSSSTISKRSLKRDATVSIGNSSTSSTDPLGSVFRRPNKIPRRRPPAKIVHHSDHISLLDRYSPKSVADLSLHSKKLKELRDWFDKHALANSEPGISLLLLTGPSGSGKLTAIGTLGKEYGLDISEWTEPLVWREWRNYKNEQSNGHLDIIRASQLEEFSSFLLRASCISSLNGLVSLSIGEQASTGQAKTGHCKLIIAKDFPTEFYDKSDEFANILKTYIRKASKTTRALLIFIVSTNGGSGQQCQRLFPKTLLEQLRFDVIEFNPIANTFLSKALKRIIDGENMSISKGQLDQLVETANGDIRFAINELQFLHSGRPSRATVSKASGRDTTLLLFRALGRCIYSKRKEDDVIELDKGEDLLPVHLRDRYARPAPLDFDPELIVAQTGYQPSMFALFLEENVWDVFQSPARGYSMTQESDELAAMANMLEMFSIVDTMVNTRDYEARDKLAVYETSLPARAVAFYAYENSIHKKGTHTYKAMHRPKWLDTARKIRSFEGKPRKPAIHVSNGSVSFSEYVPFAGKVKSQVAKAYPSSAPRLGDDSAVVEEAGDDLGPENAGNFTEIEAEKETCHLMRGEELANISIDEFDD